MCLPLGNLGLTQLRSFSIRHLPKIVVLKNDSIPTPCLFIVGGLVHVLSFIPFSSPLRYTKPLGFVRISIKANCVDSTAAPEAVFASEIDKLRKDGVKPKEFISMAVGAIVESFE